jgi:hypothetical protein
MQPAVRVSISSTCHPILPAALCAGPLSHATATPWLNAGWHASAAGRLHAKADLALPQAAHAEER